MSATESSLSRDVKDLQASLVSSQPLNLQAKQIRILKLRPGERDDPIRCELYTAYLSDQPYYEALSYVWGNPKIVKPIFVNGRQVQVTTNLEAALRTLRLREETRHMWVDALCINQTDDVEKTHQVNLMAEIYKETALGLIWLGRTFSESESVVNEGKSGTKISYHDAFNAFDLIQRMAEAGKDEHFLVGNMPSQAGTIQVTRSSCKAFHKLMRLTWWRRMWTVQEAVLPRKATVFCGCLKLDWSGFIKARRTIQRHISTCCLKRLVSIHEGFIHSSFVVFRSLLSVFKACGCPQLDMTDVLLRTTNRKTGDSRDKLYALLGLDTNWRSQLSAAVDYSLPPREVFRRMTTQLILLSNSLKPLVRERKLSTDALLPTWVNDLSAPGHHRMVNISSAYDRSNASRRKELSVQFSAWGELRSLGVLVDEVERIRGVAYTRKLDGTWPQFDDKWIDMLDLTGSESQSRPYPTGGSHLEAFMRLVLRRRFHQDACWNQHDFSVRDWLAGLNYTNINDFAVDKCLFVTKKGLIGLGPKYMEVGDTIHVLFGGNVPFLLRRVKEGEHKDSYTYVSHCYVQGIMDGEAVQDVGDGEWFTLI